MMPRLLTAFPGLLLALASTALPSLAQNNAPMFPFAIPWDDAAKNAVDVSYLNPAPLTEAHRVSTRNGRFYDGAGRRVKFLGVNFSFGANFPEKEEAEKIAARLHKYGVNMVRLHHMDGRKAPQGLWDPRFPDMQHLDPGQLDRLDYLMAQLKKQGVYVNLNLHVSRKFTEADGFPEAAALPSNGKVTAWFEPKMIELQKQFAREMIQRVNPYTGFSYAEDPAVALIEIHNEDSMVDAARDGRIEALPPHYSDMLKRDWNQFLRKRYPDQATLARAWNINPQSGKNLLNNGRFEDGQTAWQLEQTAPAVGTVQVQDISGNGLLPAGKALNLKTTAIGRAGYFLQMHHNRLDLTAGQTYTLSFWGKTPKPRRVTVSVGMGGPPWEGVGLRETVSMTEKWKRYEYTFTATRPLPGNSRLSFIMGDATGEFSIADARLYTGVSLEEGQSLDAANVPLLKVSATPWGKDSAEFLMEVERRYAEGMRDYIKRDLRARGLVTCSQSSYGGMAGIWRESKMDFVDMHAYWQHPNFPGRPWDPTNWNIQNTAMVKDAYYGTLPNLAMHRVAGKPFTVSEYNHPAPNSYNAETLPLVMAYAAWQDWDGVFLFDYNASHEVWRSDKIENYFAVAFHPGIMAFLPAAATLFLSGDAPRVEKERTLQVPVNEVLNLTAAGLVRDAWRNQGQTPQDALSSRMGVEFVKDGAVRTSLSGSDVREPALNWQPAAGQFTYRAPHAQVAVTRYDAATSAPLDLGSWQVQVTGSRLGFAALALHSRDGGPVNQSGSLLLTVAGTVENLEMGWNETRTSVGQNWGEGPVQAEGITASVALQTNRKNLEVHALDSRGGRARKVPAAWKDGALVFQVGPEYQTLWYEIVAP